MIRRNKGTFISILIGLWGLSAANGIKDFYFEMRAKTRGEIISYSSLQEFCGWTGEKQPGETEFDYGMRRARNMFSALMAMSFMSVLFFGSVIGVIFGAFWLAGGFKDDDENEGSNTLT
ncbi:MAG TPA: hypothetical protein PKM44_16415 [Turneriella sp.]|nr:hypothetical protein [Turneriella sp.]HNA80587.1 hypothetical protein [Turneriella sp.]HNJ65085.1 hypothetical protein [Turneriella sp.]HNL12097.1 hypothetical protein [Turneriella sp.]HNL53319.1 hypothetical protein [Turneriella sp.]